MVINLVGQLHNLKLWKVRESRGAVVRGRGGRGRASGRVQLHRYGERGGVADLCILRLCSRKPPNAQCFGTEQPRTVLRRESALMRGLGWRAPMILGNELLARLLLELLVRRQAPALRPLIRLTQSVVRACPIARGGTREFEH